MPLSVYTRMVPFYLLNILVTKSFFHLDKARFFAELATQFPIVLALKLGVSRLDWLIKLHSLGLIVVPLFFWLIAIALQIKSDLFWLFLLAFSVSYLSSGFCAVGEYNLDYAVTAFMASILLKNQLSYFLGACLIGAAIISLLCYPAMIYLGPLLFIITLLHLLLDPKPKNFIIIFILIITLLLLATGFYFALMSILHPRDPANLASAMTLKSALKNSHYIYLTFIGVIFLFSLVPSLKNKQYLIILALIVSLIYLLDEKFWLTPGMYYQFRTVAGLALFCILTLTAWLYFSNRNFTPHIPVFIFIVFSIPFYIHLSRFHLLINVFSHEINSQSGIIPIEKTILLSPPFKPYIWIWTNPR